MTLLQAVAASTATAFGAAVQGVVGFGLSLTAVPCLILIDPRLVPGPVLCVAIVLTLLIARRERRSIDFFGLKWSLAGRFPGTALGAATLLIVPQERIAILFAILVLAAVALSAARIRIRATAAALAGAGLISGFMATTVAIGGPPVALVLQDYPGAELRGTLSGYFLVGASVSLAALVFVGRFGVEELRLSLNLLPGILAGYWLSSHVRGILDRGHTRSAVLVLSALAALAALGRQLL